MGEVPVPQGFAVESATPPGCSAQASAFPCLEGSLLLRQGIWGVTVDSLTDHSHREPGCPKMVGMGWDPPKLALVVAMRLQLCGNGLLVTTEIAPWGRRWPPSLSRNTQHLRHTTSCLGRGSTSSLFSTHHTQTHTHTHSKGKLASGGLVRPSSSI